MPASTRVLRRLERLLLFGTAALIASGPASAQEAGPPDIIVTGRGLEATPATPAYSVREIGREAIQSSASGRIEDVLSSIAGFQQFRRSDSRSANPTAQGVTLRALGGNATSRALVLLDGVPMLDPFFGHVPLGAISPENLAHVRVTRGGGSGAFGAGAVAGTIELTSADAASLGLVNAAVLANQRGESDVSASIAPRLGQGFAVLSGHWDRGQGFHTTPADQRVAATARARFDSWSTGLRAVTPLGGDAELQVRGLVFDDRRTLRFVQAQSRTAGQDASVRLIGRGAWQFDVLGYVQVRDFSNLIVSSTSFRPTLDQRKTPSTGIGGKFELRPPVGGGHVMRIGGDARIARGRLVEQPYGPQGPTSLRRAGGRTADLGLFVEDDWTLGDVILTLGARADRWSIRDGHFSERANDGRILSDIQFAGRAGWDTSLRGGALWRAGGGLSFRTAAYTGLRLPTLNELYRPFVVFPVRTQANAELANERLRGVEAGIDFRPHDDVSLSLTAFDNRVRHAIANVTIATNLRERRNVDAIHARGLELDASMRFGPFSFEGSLAFTRADVKASGISQALDGMRPAQTPSMQASGTAIWRPAPGWRLSATLRHVGAQFEDDLESDVLPAVTTLDAFLQAPLGRGASLVVRAENLTDERIVTRNQAGSIDLGAPRTLWAGLRFDLPR